MEMNAKIIKFPATHHSIFSIILNCLNLLIFFIQNFFVSSYEICNETGVGKIYLCPRCLNGGCGYEILQNSCLYSRLTHVFDNTATVIFAIFMSFWGKTVTLINFSK